MSISEPYVVVVVIAVALLLLLWWGSTRGRQREKVIASARSSDTLETFVGSFRQEVRPIARAIYTELQQYTSTSKIPFRKADRVAEILRIGKVDLDEALKHVAGQFGCRNPTKEDDNKFRGRQTFEDFVEFIHYLKTESPQDRPEFAEKP